MMTAPSSCPSGSETPRNVFEDFLHCFNFRIAITEEEKKSVYALRHKVFCQELKYEMAGDPDKKLEWDNFDETSLHCVVEHKRTGLIAGCLRLVTLDPDASCDLAKLPIEVHCEKSIARPYLHPSSFNKNNICEASRLAISQHFRKWNEGSPTSPGQAIEFTDAERKTFPLIIIGLFLSSYALAELASRDHMFAMMEPGLPRLLRKAGFNFLNIGGPVSFHGIRHPFYINSKQASSGMKPELFPLYRSILQQLSAQRGQNIAPVLPVLRLRKEHIETTS